MVKAFSEEAKLKIGNASRLWWSNPENRAKMSAKHKQNYLDNPELKSKTSHFGNTYTFGRKQSEQEKKLHSEKMKENKHLLGHIHSEESRKKMSQAHIGVSKSKSHAEALRRHLRSIQSPTSIEIILGQKIRKEFPRRKIIREYPLSYFRYDFAIPGLKLLFEADGEYWHSTPSAKRRDKSKNTFAKNNGWTLFRFTGTELKNWAKENL